MFVILSISGCNSYQRADGLNNPDSIALSEIDYPALTEEYSIGELDYDDILINKVDHSIFIEGDLIGDFFYEKPHIPGDSAVVEKINDYFNKDCDDFFFGSAMFQGDDAFQRVKSFIDGVLELGEEKFLIMHPYRYYVTTEMTFLSEAYISFRQRYVRAVGGPHDTWNNGVTFSLSTGELVSFIEFFDVKANTFKKNLCDILLSQFNNSPRIQEDIINIYGPNEDNSFSIMYYGTEIALDKHFFYDGQSINLTLNYGLFPHDGLIIKMSDIMDEMPLLEE